MNVLLQILDDGEITDSHGRKVNFENTVIVMTSNAGSERKEGTVGFGHTLNDQNRDRAMKALGEFLRPEFLNRVDEVICFNRLDEKNFAGIAHIMLDELQKSLEDKGLHFTWDEDVEDYLVKKSYSATYGARNLRRTIHGRADHRLLRAPRHADPCVDGGRQARRPQPVKERGGRPCSICSARTLKSTAPTARADLSSTKGRSSAPAAAWSTLPTTVAISATIRSSACRRVRPR